MDAADIETREFYAHFGLAIYQAQVVEHAIVNLMTALRLPERGRLTRGDIDNLMNEAFTMTFGRLVGELRRQTDSADVTEAELGRARERRNWLATTTSESVRSTSSRGVAEPSCWPDYTTPNGCSSRSSTSLNDSLRSCVPLTG